jgi:alpha-beta hydrolase superfamily lysophospholipase
MFNEYLEVITDADQKITISAYFAENSNKSILINHGMAEHQRRYKEFINFLNLNGINVFIYDHRGHGNRITSSELIGVFAKQNGWSSVVNDLTDISNFLVNKFSQHTFSLFGHSMGSYITLDSIQSGNPIKNVILSGSSVPDGPILMFQNIFLKLSNLLKGKENYSRTMHDLVFGGFNKSIKNSRTPSDWLSYSASSVDDYIADPLCGFVVSNSLWSDLLVGFNRIFDKNRFHLYHSNLDVLILSGKEDAAGGFGSGPKKLHKILSSKISNCTLKIYDDMRHEILNEPTRNIVYDDVLHYLINK